MTLSQDIRYTIASHTANMPRAERVARVNELIRKYSITNTADRAEAAMIAAVRVEDLK